MRPFIQLALVALVAVAAVPASARAPITSDTIEASAHMLSMPATPDGILVVKTCPTCKGVTLKATADTLYLLGKQQVSLQDFSAFTRSNGDAFVAVSYELSSTKLIRMTASLPTRAP